MATLFEAEANLTTQNQITVPADVRKVLKLRGGKSRIKFQILPTGKVMVVRAEARAPQEKDVALRPFLKLLAKDIEKAPEWIKPFSRPLLERARSVVADVKVDLHGPLTGED